MKKFTNENARRSSAKIIWDGVDITESLQPFLLSISYTDNENDETDDLEIELQDRDGNWLDGWLETLIDVAGTPVIDDEMRKANTPASSTKADSSDPSAAGNYVVTPGKGLNVRSGPGTGYGILGALPRGTVIAVSGVENGWAVFTYNGQKAYSSMGYLSSTDASPTLGSSGNLSGSSGTTTVTGGQRVPALYTAYVKGEGGNLDSQGHELDWRENTCAAPIEIKCGTRVTVQGTGTSRDGQTYTVTDRGGLITLEDGVYHFDILMASSSEAKEWGRKRGFAILNGTPVASSTKSRAVPSKPVQLRGATVPDMSRRMARFADDSGDPDGGNTPGGGSDDTTIDDTTTNDEDAQEIQVAEQPFSTLRFQVEIIRHNWLPGETQKSLFCGMFELDSVEAAGPPATVTLRGTSLPFGTKVRRTPHSKAWEACTLHEIAEEITKNAGLLLLYDTNVTPKYSRMEQVKTSDIAFLSTLCHDAGLCIKASDGMLIIFDCAAYEKRPPILTIGRKDGSYLDYSLQTGTADTQCTSCHVSYVAPDGGCVEGMAYAPGYDEESENNQRLEITAKVDDEEQAMKLAEKRLMMHNRYFKTAVFTLPGNPDLVAGVVVALKGWSLYDGNYVVEQAKHTVDDSGYTTQITLRWAQTAITKIEPVKKKKTKKKSSSGSSSSAGSSSNSSSSSSSSSASNEIGEAIIAEGLHHWGTPFSMGGSSPGCFDCSGFVSWVINHATARNVGRPTAQGLYDISTKIDRSELQKGDLVFFAHTYPCDETVTHVGFFTSGTQMLHCGGSGVSYADFMNPYWSPKLYGFGRIR